MKEIKYYALPLDKNGICNDESFVNKAEELGYVWSQEGFKQALDDKELNIAGMWIKVIVTERN